jgi:hypothetical protein
MVSSRTHKEGRLKRFPRDPREPADPGSLSTDLSVPGVIAPQSGSVRAGHFALFGGNSNPVRQSAKTDRYQPDHGILSCVIALIGKGQNRPAANRLPRPPRAESGRKLLIKSSPRYPQT